ncbi:endonuclease/exonuclease/phosphatase family protein [Paenibacillus sp. RC67]|uniref:endonuclease/exonuclease/phosphatase family protein n=1 Tax=Paenibacillus sp. RC67 TaxID=3039392 RepID=UPI0024AD11DC|nr:endonuclease/exonuclease/phosphatase family protein [Paenibacillus sp. RC67]
MQLQMNTEQGSGKRLRNGGALSLSLLIVVFAISILLVLSWLPVGKALSRPSYSAANKLTLMTFNIRHAKGLDGQVRLQSVRDALSQGKADLIALQEVDRFQGRSGFQDQARALSQSLHMTFLYAPAMSQGVSQYGIALLSRFPLINPHTYPLPGEKEPRVVLTAQMEIQRPHNPSQGQQGREQELVTIVTTHLGVTRADRERQMPELLRILKEIRTPIVLLGDLNMTDQDPLMKELNETLHQARLPASESTVLHGGQIDHIFTSFPGLEDTPAWTKATKASDHVPVLYKVALFQGGQ